MFRKITAFYSNDSAKISAVYVFTFLCLFQCIYFHLFILYILYIYVYIFLLVCPTVSDCLIWVLTICLVDRLAACIFSQCLYVLFLLISGALQAYQSKSSMGICLLSSHSFCFTLVLLICLFRFQLFFFSLPPPHPNPQPPPPPFLFVILFFLRLTLSVLFCFVSSELGYVLTCSLTGNVCYAAEALNWPLLDLFLSFLLWCCRNRKTSV